MIIISVFLVEHVKKRGVFFTEDVSCCKSSTTLSVQIDLWLYSLQVRLQFHKYTL